MSDLERRCGSCARFVRVVESIDENGEVKRLGECLLNVWPSPLKETMTCSSYLKRGTVHAHLASAHRSARTRAPRPAGSARVATAAGETDARVHVPLDLPEELLDMNADEFREVLRDVIREELGAGEVELGARWVGGELIMKPGKEGTQEKRLPIDAFFHKVVMIRDKLRVLEQRINSHGKLSADEKVQLQQYVTGCYGTLTTFNVLFATREDGFIGDKGTEWGEACLGVALLVTLLGCAHASEGGDVVSVGRSLKPEGATAPVEFKFDSLDDREVSTGTVLGKPTVIAFVTTWDLSSQAQIDFLVPMAKRSASSSNYVMVALQEPADRELVEVYAQHLGVTFPVAMADKDALAEVGSFGELNAVPTIVILDRAARVVWRHVGLARPEEIRAGLSGL